MNQLTLKSTVSTDDITNEISKMFDYQFTGESIETIVYPDFPKEFKIGLIVGSSGSGKSTILKNCFGNIDREYQWDNSKSIASHFESAEIASKMFGAVGLNSIPTWLKPYGVLSTGEKFRANMAIRLKDCATIDEFTSVVNRDVAKSCSMSISKYINNNDIHNVVFCSCHDDIIEYLQPDWIYNTDTKELSVGRSVRQSSLSIHIEGCTQEAWYMFKRHHYLSADLNSSCNCYIGLLNNRPIAFGAIIAQPGRDIEHAYREHRIVVLPDFQGMGIGNKFSEALGQAYIESGCRYFGKTSNPRMGEHRNHSPLWRATINNQKSRESYLTTDGNIRTHKVRAYGMTDDMIRIHAYRICYSHEYIGDGRTYPFTYKTIEDLQSCKGMGKKLF